MTPGSYSWLVSRVAMLPPPICAGSLNSLRILNPGFDFEIQIVPSPPWSSSAVTVVFHVSKVPATTTTVSYPVTSNENTRTFWLRGSNVRTAVV